MEDVEKLSNKSEVARRHLELSQQWSDVYEAGTTDGGNAKIVFDNPIAYIKSGNVDNLPDDLRDRWEKLQYLCALFVVNHSGETRTDNPTDSLVAVQEIIEKNDDDNETRGAIAGIIYISSELFADSIQIRSGDIRRYERSLKKMADLLPAEK